MCERATVGSSMGAVARIAMPMVTILTHLRAGVTSLVEVSHRLEATAKIIDALAPSSLSSVIPWFPVRCGLVREACMLVLFVARLDGEG